MMYDASSIRRHINQNWQYCIETIGTTRRGGCVRSRRCVEAIAAATMHPASDAAFAFNISAAEYVVYGAFHASCKRKMQSADEKSRNARLSSTLIDLPACFYLLTRRIIRQTWVDIIASVMPDTKRYLHVIYAQIEILWIRLPWERLWWSKNDRGNEIFEQMLLQSGQVPM